MTIETKELKRVFRYNSLNLPDPGPSYTPEEVRDFYSATYAEIVSAAIEGPERKGDAEVYTFRKHVGTKGAREVLPEDIRDVLSAEFPETIIQLAGDEISFGGERATECRERAVALHEKAKLFNAHLACGHVGNKRNWWKRV